MQRFPHLPASKQALRKQALSIRHALPIDEVSERICKHLAGWPVFQNAQRVLFYYPFRQEVDLRLLIPKMPQKNWYLPVVADSDKPGAGGELSFFRYEAGSPLRVGKYGIAEPPADTAPLGRLQPEDLILVPALLFDRAGHRLGYGKGYYDRFLARAKSEIGGLPLCAGVCPNVLWIDQLPADAWDIPLPFIITEEGVFETFSREANPGWPDCF